MTVPVVAFFNNKGGVGKTSLVYHTAWMLSEMGCRTVAADLDPQANLTGAFFDEDSLERLYDEGNVASTIHRCVLPLKEGTGDIADPAVQDINGQLGLLAGDLALSEFEDSLSEVWPKCLDRDQRSFRITSAFYRVMQKSAEIRNADIILLDLGPNLGAINRAALISSDHVVIPLAPDLFSQQGLRNMGPRLREWRDGWVERSAKNPVKNLELPRGSIEPIGYVVLQHTVRLDRPMNAYAKWIKRIPDLYSEHVLGMNLDVRSKMTIETDPNCLALLKNYQSLMPMAQEARKPMFLLKAADGAHGSHYSAAQRAGEDFRELAAKILHRIGVAQPSQTPTRRP